MSGLRIAHTHKLQQLYVFGDNYLIVFCLFSVVRRYGSDLVLIESYTENNYTATLARRSLGPADRNNQKYWLGLASLDDLRTNTLEYAGGVLVSQYSGKYPKSNARLIRYTKKIVEILKPPFFFFRILVVIST